MMKKVFSTAALLAVMSVPAMAGGLLTNTNQNAAFLRNPARDAVIAIDGVNNNPAGVAFLPQGFHLSLTWQVAFQKRLMDVENPLFALGDNDGGQAKRFEGKSVVPVIPSFQAAYVFNDRWSASAQFAIGSGGGKCEFGEGLPMFEELVGGLINQNPALPTPYGLSQQLTGEQYFYGLQLGGTYRIAENLSVFGGLRGVLANCSYTGSIANIMVAGKPAATQTGLAAALLGQPLVLDCQQKGFGLTPIVGIDWKLGRWNLAAKYEFRTRMNLENKSANSANLDALATQVPAVAVYADGNKVRSDIPSILAMGAQFQATSTLRAMAGFHYYWDRKAKGTAILEGDNTWEVLAGLEWDVTDRILLGIGAQRTQYGFADSDISDLNYNACSTTVCIGGAYRLSEMFRLNVGYMHGFYDKHTFENAAKTKCTYTRRNDVIGVSLDMKF